MKKLGNTVLPDGLQWQDRYEWTPVAQEVVRTLSGKQVLFCATLTGGQPVTLEAESQVAWIEKNTLNSIAEMAMQTGAIFTLEWEGELMSVVFRHHEPPVINVTPIWPHHNLYTGTIRLMVA